MKVFKTLLAIVVIVGVLGAAAYGGGYLLRQHDQHPVASSTGAPGGPATDDPTTGPTTSPTADPSSPTTHPSPSVTHTPRPAPAVLQPGAQGTQVRELQQRLFQLAWFPETTTGVYDDATVAAVKGFQDKRGLRATGVPVAPGRSTGAGRAGWVRVGGGGSAAGEAGVVVGSAGTVGVAGLVTGLVTGAADTRPWSRCRIR